MNPPSTAAPLTARSAVTRLVASQIREVANAGMGDPSILPFWFGEPDEVTPAFIRDAATAALARGETFYTENLGLPELRATIAAYVSRLHRPTAPDKIAVTASGMSALMLATEALVDPGDRVVVVTPLWPNLAEIPKILGGDVVRVPLAYRASGWTLDLDRLLAALTPATRALLINSPNNPTGWTLTATEQQAILAHCRRHGIWIVADDAYERLFFEDTGNGNVAPSFLDLADPDDRVVSTNTFSKSWLMTGWRLGWIAAPRALILDLAKLVEYNTSCAPPFVQRAGVVAVTRGEDVIARSVARLRAARDILHASLAATPGIVSVAPPGAMYAFFRVAGLTDSLDFCKRLVAETGLGLAPGIAFGPEGEGFVRWCFASSEARLADGVDRLRRFLARPQGAT